MTTVRVKVIRSHILGAGRFAEVGDILDLPEHVATERITNGSVEPAPPEPTLESPSSDGDIPGIPSDPAPEGLAAQSADSPTETGAPPPTLPTPEEVAAAAAAAASGTTSSSAAEPAGATAPAKGKASKENSKS